jgi:hypothetical protein
LDNRVLTGLGTGMDGATAELVDLFRDAEPIDPLAGSEQG